MGRGGGYANNQEACTDGSNLRWRMTKVTDKI